MPTQRKIFTVANLSEKFNQAKGLVLSDYSGLNVAQMNELRTRVKKAGGEFEVIKNTLLCLAARNSKCPLRGIPSECEIRNSKLEGPTAALWLYENEIEPLKAFFQFSQANRAPLVKFGFLEGMQISLERLKELASLPSKKELQAQLAAILQSPLSGLARVLNGNMQRLVLTIRAAYAKASAAKGGEKNGR